MLLVRYTSLVCSLLALLGASLTSAQEGSAPPANSGDGAAEMARKLQNPLANIAALMTDNDISFDAGNEENTAYQFQLQPVYAFDFAELGFTFLPRAVIPIIGAPAGADLPPIGSPEELTEQRTWGLGDIVTQFFFAPALEGSWKFGFGPQLSWKTRTDSALAGPEWGAGIAAVVVGGFGDNFSIAPLVSNLWSYDGDFSLLSMQLNAYYNFDFLPGSYIAYNAPITADWKASSSNTWTLPLGAVVGKTFDVGGGHGLDLSFGGFGNVVKPDEGPKWSLKFGIAWLFPR
jgi:hypothetical protein